jgi:uncharacterized membrane protein
LAWPGYTGFVGEPGSLVGTHPFYGGKRRDIAVLPAPPESTSVCSFALAASHGGFSVNAFGISRSRRESLRTNLWLVPSVMVVLVTAMFVITYVMDRLASAGTVSLPGLIAGGPDAARGVLIAVAAAVITVAGLVFSITILVLQLASQQFGPRMLRNFIRDFGTQVSLGAFVSTFVYSVLALGAVQSSSPSFVPHLCVTVALALTLIDLGVLIYFIHHVASSIQLPTVVSGIARDFRTTLAAMRSDAERMRRNLPPGAAHDRGIPPDVGAPVVAGASGFLQAIGHERLVKIGAESNATITLISRPGHFIARGQTVGHVFPPEAAATVSEALERSHIVGPYRTLTQDGGFAIDQLVEVAIRALSPAVNDTFTAMNCIDWLGDCLCRAATQPLPDGIYRDRRGIVRLVEPVITMERLVKGATDKIRQAGSGMPAIYIRQLQNFEKVAAITQASEQRGILEQHAVMIVRASNATVTETTDRDDVQAAFDGFLSVLGTAQKVPAGPHGNVARQDGELP